MPGLHVPVAFGGQGRKIALRPDHRLLGGLRVALNLRSTVHRGDGVKLASDVQMLQLFTHLLDQFGVG